MEKKIGRMINMKLFPVLKARLTFQEPLAGRTSGATWNMKTEPAGGACVQRQGRTYYMAHRLPGKGYFNVQKPTSSQNSSSKIYIALESFTLPSLLECTALGWCKRWLWCKPVVLDHKSSCLCPPPQRFSCSVICRLCARHCSKKHFYSTIFVICLAWEFLSSGAVPSFCVLTWGSSRSQAPARGSSCIWCTSSRCPYVQQCRNLLTQLTS